MTKVENQLAQQLAQSALRSKEMPHYRQTDTLHGKGISHLATPDAHQDFIVYTDQLQEILDQIDEGTPE